jgi:NhaP-type Na+/H+ or K+/H+ antiporter
VAGNVVMSFLYIRSSSTQTLKRSSDVPPVEANVHSPVSRSLSSSDSSSSSSTHQHDALLFLFNMVLIGTTVLYLTSIFHGMQLSITLFVIGMLLSLILEGANVKESIGLWGDSYSMWMDIDPHLLLFTMLPTLLAGDAMTIDTSVASRVGKQCLYLAGPGVLLSAMITAVVLKYFLDWSFLLSLTTSSILCATDPVAVVALLKELGASPTLTVQIQGESLLNDGTAIVLYTVAYDMLSGVTYDFADMSMFLVRTAIMACALGVFLGYFFFSWLRLAGDRFNHSAGVIQILLTMCAAYWSFVLAEGVMSMSGVLATVCCSLVLAHHMWPHIVDREAMVDFWHVMENLGNIIIFVLGGALVGTAMLKIDAIDYLRLIFIYIVLTFLRGSLIFASRPLLKMLHRDKEPVSWQDATIMTWGGLRGAVGLALGMQVNRGKATNDAGVAQITDDDANRVLFFVAGIAFLTTCVNASTCPALVAWLGVTALPESEATMLYKFNQQMVHESATRNNPPAVTERLQQMLNEIAHSLFSKKTNFSSLVEVGEMQSSEDILEAYHRSMQEFYALPETDRADLDCLPHDHGGQVSKMVKLLPTSEPKADLVKMVNKIFLSLVSTNYRKQIGTGNLRPGSDEADLLFSSVRFSTMKLDLVDFALLNQFCCQAEEEADGVSRLTAVLTKQTESACCIDADAAEAALQNKAKGKEESQTCTARFVRSGVFNASCAIAILSNVMYVGIEEAARNDDNDGNAIWVIIEGFFAFVFLLEFVLKFDALKFGYFSDAWNCFDSFLVVMGIAGLVMSLATMGAETEASEGSSESRVIRISRVLRTMRFLRLFRLFHARLSADKYVSVEVVATMKAMQVMKSFVQAHMESQALMMKYFTDAIDESNEVEMARCLLQSQVAVYQACIAEINVRNADQDLYQEVKRVRHRKGVIEGLELFVEEALKQGAITQKNAGCLLHPLHHEVSHCLHFINERAEGFTKCEEQQKSVAQCAESGSHSEGKQVDLGAARSLADHLARLDNAEEGDAAAGVKPSWSSSPAEDKSPTEDKAPKPKAKRKMSAAKPKRKDDGADVNEPINADILEDEADGGPSLPSPPLGDQNLEEKALDKKRSSKKKLFKGRSSQEPDQSLATQDLGQKMNDVQEKAD